MNPFLEKPITVEKALMNWCEMFPRSYNKKDVDPYTRCRIILMNGTEFEANWFSHNFARHTDDGELRRALALSRAVEKEQQLKTSLIKPADETILEHTIGYEQLAVDLTAELAKRESDCNVKRALDFALLEDFDHLYRYSDLLYMQDGIAAENLVGKYTEIMPARPTLSHHRFPKDNVRRCINAKKSSVSTVLNTMIITAAEQQTMNYYMNVTTLAKSDIARRLYEEIAMVEEEHVTHYESLMDPNSTWLEMLLWHEYCECYLYWSCYMTETDRDIKQYWEDNLITEISHLHSAKELLAKYEGKEWNEVIPSGEFPAPISLHENIDYVRDILGTTAQFTTDKYDYKKIDELPSDADFFAYQKFINGTGENTPSHKVIDMFISRYKTDYRFEIKENPIPELRDRKVDNICVGRVPGAAKSTDFKCNSN